MLPVLGKKAVLEWCMKEGFIGSSYVCPKCGKSMGKKERWNLIEKKGDVIHCKITSAVYNKKKEKARDCMTTDFNPGSLSKRSRQELQNKKSQKRRSFKMFKLSKLVEEPKSY
ncbi:hypothetical protein TNCV_5106581 [Trichonephila clavipes]|uniref:Uncharacterized protein n=1 Tax=Trichonephila clavipes TaxID=2585209 RepID=A0A8X6R9Q2_TRICX|nr:hypothetical protein TNCV_5106581 [Trichonephila clavipes]